MTESSAAEVWSFLETETDGQRLHVSAVPMAAEAHRLGRRVKKKPCGVVFGRPDQDSIETLSAQGLAKLYRIDAEQSSAAPDGREQAIRTLWARHRPSHLLFAATARGCDLAARVALGTRSGFVPQVVDYEGRRGEPLSLRTSVYGNRAHRRMQLSDDGSWIFSIYPASLSTGRARGDDNLEQIDVVFDNAVEPATRCLRFDGVRSIPPAEIDVSEARIVVGVGRGIGNESNLALIREFADRLGATVGGSRVAVEMGLIPVERQIGLSGKSLQADVYVACGISGASHHLIGIQAVKHVVAINRDASAPLMKMADLALIGDVNEVLPHLLLQLDDGNGLASSR